jgi:hypothetical protein
VFDIFFVQFVQALSLKTARDMSLLLRRGSAASRRNSLFSFHSAPTSFSAAAPPRGASLFGLFLP